MNIRSCLYQEFIKNHIVYNIPGRPLDVGPSHKNPSVGKLTMGPVLISNVIVEICVIYEELLLDSNVRFLSHSLSVEKSKVL